MKTKILNVMIVLWSCLWFFSCANDDLDADILLECESIDHISDLPWLQAKFEEIEFDSLSGVILYQYNSREVIEIQSSLMSSTNQSQYYCDGSRINLDNPEVYQDFLKNSLKIKILYGTDLWGRN